MISRIIAAYRQRKAMRAASVLAKHRSFCRQAFRAKRDAKLALFRADSAAGRISNLGWKQ